MQLVQDVAMWEELCNWTEAIVYIYVIVVQKARVREAICAEIHVVNFLHDAKGFALSVKRSCFPSHL